MKSIAAILLLAVMSFFSLTVFDSCKKEDVTAPGNKPVVLLEKFIDVTTSDVLAELPGELSILIPRGALSEPATLKISTLAGDIPMTGPNNEYTVLKAYNIEIGDQKTFSKPLKITFKLSESLFADTSRIKNIKPAYYDEAQKQWLSFYDPVFDKASVSMQFFANHLTPCGPLEYFTNGFYERYLKTPHYTIYYTYNSDHKPMTDEDYNNNAQRPWYTKENEGIPKYVQDIGHYLEYADSVYRKVYDLKIPANTNIYVKNNGGDGLYGPWTESIYINNKVERDIEFLNLTTNEDYLRMATAHELFHLIQDYYYSFIMGGKWQQWWLEAMATQADRLVYPNCSIYESMMYSQKVDKVTGARVLQMNLSRSWDDCNSDPAYYVAGTFLFYLQHYRPGTKLDVVRMMKNLGNPSGRYYRTLLNNELLSQTGSTLGNEYSDFVNLLYRETEPYFRINNPFYNQTDPNLNPVFKKEEFTDANNKLTETISIPYLSAKILKFSNLAAKDTVYNELSLTISAGTGQYTAYLYQTFSKASQPPVLVDIILNNETKVLDFKKKSYDLVLVSRELENTVDLNITSERRKAAYNYVSSYNFNTYPDMILGPWKNFKISVNSLSLTGVSGGRFRVGFDRNDPNLKYIKIFIPTPVTVSKYDLNISLGNLEFASSTVSSQHPNETPELVNARYTSSGNKYNGTLDNGRNWTIPLTITPNDAFITYVIKLGTAFKDKTTGSLSNTIECDAIQVYVEFDK